ncbi:MAG: hypothetical protein Q4F56_01785, partial [Candidatus Saccharibacteria bacterium]|nr:hypothetical protein [Candidatus Saccharibacteria bacterium]
PLQVPQEPQAPPGQPELLANRLELPTPDQASHQVPALDLVPALALDLMLDYSLDPFSLSFIKINLLLSYYSYYNII